MRISLIFFIMMHYVLHSDILDFYTEQRGFLFFPFNLVCEAICENMDIVYEKFNNCSFLWQITCYSWKAGTWHDFYFTDMHFQCHMLQSAAKHTAFFQDITLFWRQTWLDRCLSRGIAWYLTFLWYVISRKPWCRCSITGHITEIQNRKWHDSKPFTCFLTFLYYICFRARHLFVFVKWDSKSQDLRFRIPLS